MFDGNLFQRLGADAVNDLSPKVSIKICCALHSTAFRKKPYHYFFC